MLAILAITAPIYFMIVLGFTFTRLGVFAKADMRVFGKFIVNLAMPALVFRALAQRTLDEIMHVDYLLAYALGSLTTIAIAYAWCRPVSRIDPTRTTFYAIGMSCSNSGFIGYPILLLTLAPVAGVALALNMIVENLLVLPLLLFMAERGRLGSGSWRMAVQPFLRLARNPLVIGLVGGLLVSVSGWHLPAPVVRTVDMLANVSSALSLFVIGGTLVGLRLRGALKPALSIAAAKLLLHPSMVLMFILLLPVLGMAPMQPMFALSAVLMASVPMASIYATLAQAYGHESFAAVTLLAATVMSFFTLSAGLLVMHSLPIFQQAVGG
ncbi:AEC family transporter [Pseudomonas sp. dw_358]|uniref:AEC family transporter n=1 Tax=Pseudomonas sp. dw_358 TaxID=2720083 RepID=UPI001BD3A3F7|nr:AEC family transporter [Pseudomonas sp. dw_358]